MRGGTLVAEGGMCIGTSTIRSAGVYNYHGVFSINVSGSGSAITARSGSYAEGGSLALSGGIVIDDAPNSLTVTDGGEVNASAGAVIANDTLIYVGGVYFQSGNISVDAGGTLVARGGIGISNGNAWKCFCFGIYLNSTADGSISIGDSSVITSVGGVGRLSSISNEKLSVCSSGIIFDEAVLVRHASIFVGASGMLTAKGATAVADYAGTRLTESYSCGIGIFQKVVVNIEGIVTAKGGIAKAFSNNSQATSCGIGFFNGNAASTLTLNGGRA